MAIAHVAMPIAAWQYFDYWIPDGLDVARGDAVRARLGNRRSVGIVVAVDAASDFADRVQPIDALAGIARLPEDLMAMADFVSAYYQAPIGLAHALLVPPSASSRRRAAESTSAVADASLHAALNAAQAEALAVIGASETFVVTLLHGVTGSGKTNVYLAAAQRAVARGGQVLILVPEINLTPQFEGRVRAALPNVRAVTLHSRLAAGVRRANWDAAAAGDAQVVLATRLGVFAPLPRLSLIVVDEEHDDSFKQQDGVRYHARDLAVWRAQRRDVPIVLGSATPSLETWTRARAGRCQIATLAKRADVRARPPAVRFVPVRGGDAHDGVTPGLQSAMAARVARNEQSLIFVNRRGYAPSLKCAACGFESQCPRCASRLVVHRSPDRLRCHHCGHARPLPRACPDCGNVDLLPLGFGTQRLEQSIRAAFPQARIARVDRDTTRSKDAFATLRRDVEAQAIDILIGTQMLAKGHDFPRLTLVGVLGADNALYSADFRATERLAALLMQVAGRAGRADREGEVIVQTDFPGHPVYRALAAHDYARFADDLAREREAAQLPPATRIALLVAEAHARADVDAFLDRAFDEASALSRDDDAIRVFPPAPAAMPRRRGYERGHLIAQSADRRALLAFVPRWREALAAAAHARVRFALDVDPIGF
ncbi:MAG TPA: primosomal protein N' [Casimicrobiaceae bacterium]|jgi:primosomal protein N' (replication factor Y)|nr:primosomal protein N' [Casimicrobiaceae bacterium]